MSDSDTFGSYQKMFTWGGRTVDVAQLVVRSLPIPEVPGSNPVIKMLYC